MDVAIGHYRLAAYLDPGFAMPRLRLGLLARRRGDDRAAAAELDRALHLLRDERDDRIVLFGGGFGRIALTALCRAELRRLRGARDDPDVPMARPVGDRLAELRADFDRSFAEPARRPRRRARTSCWRSGPAAARTRCACRRPPGCYPDRPVTPLPGPLPRAARAWPGSAAPIVPVYDLAALLGHPVPERPRWLVLAAGAPPLALAFHELDGHVRVPAASIIDRDRRRPAPGCLRGMVPLPGGTRPIVDLPAARAAVHALTGHADKRGATEMMAGRTFGSKLAGGFGLTVVLTLLMGAASVAALTVVVSSKDGVITAADEQPGRRRAAEHARRRAGSATSAPTCSTATRSTWT